MGMGVNSVLNCTHIIRSQVEYSESTGSVILRCVLETPATGERRGFTDVGAMMEALQNELLDIQNQIMPPHQE